ncbi:MAG: PorT family protein [Bacteroidales bacterium]|nr:PorT family protein [Bacteroidales bacterium]MBN2758402.1 PorT family protein [Bacteroidales bacterium]
MKKIVITFTFMIFFAISGISQIIKPGIGFNYTSFNNDPLSYEKTGRLGFQLGGSVAFGETIYFEPGIYWVRNNYELKDVDLNVDFKNDISSIRIPLFVGINVVGDAAEERNFHIFAGPAISFVTDVNTGDTGLTTDDFNKFLWGANLGAGLSLWKMYVDVGYEWGLNDLFKDDPNNTKTKGLWVNVGFRLTFL